MMYGKRYRIEGVLRLDEDLHIGSSRREPHPRDPERERVVVMRGARSEPLIPASSLKGALRANLENARSVLGEASEHEAGRGKAARLWIENAFAVEGCSESRWDEHVSIDRRTGAALDNHLFEIERLPSGATFKFAADWLHESTDGLARALAPLCQGLHLGKGTTKGHGRLELEADDSLEIFVVEADATGSMTKTKIPGQERAKLIQEISALASTGQASSSGSPSLTTAWRRISLELACDGPFLSIAEVDDNDQDGEGNVARPLMRDRKPWMHPETFIGALRSRAAWLAEVSRARAMQDNRPLDVPMDDRKLERALGGQRRVSNLGDVARLSWVERLFGVTGWRGRLELVSLACTEAGSRMRLTSNSLDRVTGATREGFLYARDAFWNPTFRVEIAIPERDVPVELDELLKNLEQDGLELGHATTKGFGWFKVRLLSDSGRTQDHD